MLDRQVDHMVRLVDDLMEVARIKNGVIKLQQRRMDLSDALAAALELSQSHVNDGRHALAVVPSAEPLWVVGDEVRLAQVFSNLINNAAKYTPKGGRITVTARAVRNEAVVDVQDTGIGIAPEDMEVLFTLFGRLKPDDHTDGLGIGLALARRLVELHGGSISVSSDGPGKGSRFTVSLPLSEHGGNSGPVRPDAAMAGVPGQRVRVLVVDDNRDSADSLGMLLEAINCEAIVCYSGAEALRALERFAPSVAFLDLGMPEMDGHALAAKIRRTRGGNLKLVALTGWGQPEDRARSAASGFDFHIAKPVTMEQIIAMLTAEGAQ